MRTRSTGTAGFAVLAALAAVLLSGCELREGAASEYGSSESGYGVKNLHGDQNELAGQISGSEMRKF